MPPLDSPQPLTEEALAQLGALAMAEAIAFLARHQALTPATVEQLAAVALATAEIDVVRAAHWLAIAETVETQVGNQPARLASLAYTRARIAVHQGEVTAAEAALRQAQSLWQSIGDAAGYSRSLLGLTQILAMQGRYDEAESAARAAVAQADAAAARTKENVAFAALMRRVAAHHNLATLLLYQEHHAEALAEHTTIRQLLTADGVAETALTNEAFHREWLHKLAHSDLNRATALTFLDQPAAAEAALQEAIARFAQANDAINQGRCRTNLGRLALRTGQYAAALTHFESAFRDLLGPTATIAGATLEELRLADELLLEYATACLAINLLPEAGQALTQCETLFRTATQPYELGQTRYTQGLLFLRTQQWKLAQSALTEAATLFAALENHFWLNRTRLAQAALAYGKQEYVQARQWLVLLLAVDSTTTTVAESALAWDLLGQVEARLLQIRLDLAAGDLAAARQQATQLTALLQSTPSAEANAPAWPHLHLRLEHLLGKIAYSAGEHQTARDHFKAAIAHLEAQRATLLVEEIRSAFVDDKSELYADLVQTLLAMPSPDSTTAAAMLAEAFAVVEQSRSRVLLERLQAALDDTARIGVAAAPDAAAEQQRLAELRAQLHWLYNQLMGESGRRRLGVDFGATINRQLQITEAALQQIEWRQSPLLAQAQAVDLAAFQAVLAPDQQAIVYAEINQEVLAFLVDRASVHIYRRLTTLPALTAAIDEFRFQMGRVEVDPAYVARHSQRLESRLRAALQQLHTLLLAPLRSALVAQRLLFVPFGPIHRLPLHALWDGDHYLIEATECSYMPSASLAVFRQARNGSQPLQTWTGFAIDDPAIPAARREVERIASHFARPTTYTEAAANRANLWQAAAESDILHLATHGLFRPDNPFFSALKMADGWVDVRELYRLPLTARLIVLSACESGVGEIAGGDEVVGLARGFLGAGRDPAGRELIASLWNVHDATAADLMDQFYAALLDTDQGRPATALRTAQCRAIAQHQHPYYWAPFFVIGA